MISAGFIAPLCSVTRDEASSLPLTCSTTYWNLCSSSPAALSMTTVSFTASLSAATPLASLGTSSTGMVVAASWLSTCRWRTLTCGEREREREP